MRTRASGAFRSSWCTDSPPDLIYQVGSLEFWWFTKAEEAGQASDVKNIKYLFVKKNISINFEFGIQITDVIENKVHILWSLHGPLGRNYISWLNISWNNFDEYPFYKVSYLVNSNASHFQPNIYLNIAIFMLFLFFFRLNKNLIDW